MNIEELSKAIDVTEATIKSQFKRTVSKMEKEGVILKKIGRGEKAEYTLEYNADFNDSRAETIFKEERADIYLEDSMVRMLDWDLLIFLGVCLSPKLSFRGSYEDFLKYVSVIPSAANIKLLKKSLTNLNEDYIGYYPDKTDETYFTASIYRQVEKEMKVSISQLIKCKEIQVKYNNRSFIPILKTWLATEKAIEHQPYTIKDLTELTNLPMSTIKKTNKILKEEGVYRSKRAFSAEFCVSQGVNSEMNGFY